MLTTIPQKLFEKRSPTNGSVHASSVFKDDNGELIAWFQQNLIAVINWECPHPNDGLPMGAPRNFRHYIGDIETLNLKVWVIESDQRANGYLTLVDTNAQELLLSGRADFIITDNTCNLSDYLFQ